jgi:hypothetical protein
VLEFENVEFVEEVQALQTEADHALPEIEFLRGAVPGGVDDDFGLVAGLVEDGEFGGWRRRGAFDAPDADSGVLLSVQLVLVIFRVSYRFFDSALTCTLSRIAFTSLLR